MYRTCYFVCVPVCMHVCRAYAPYVCVLNQYLHSACRLSWVSQFDKMFCFCFVFLFFFSLHMFMMSVKVYSLYVCDKWRNLKVNLVFDTAGSSCRTGESCEKISWAGQVIPRTHNCYCCKNWTRWLKCTQIKKNIYLYAGADCLFHCRLLLWMWLRSVFKLKQPWFLFLDGEEFKLSFGTKMRWIKAELEILVSWGSRFKERVTTEPEISGRIDVVDSRSYMRSWAVGRDRKNPAVGTSSWNWFPLQDVWTLP